jgi:hypothetical protein
MFLLPDQDKPGAVAEIAAHGYSAAVVLHPDDTGANLCKDAGLYAYAVRKFSELGVGDESSRVVNVFGEQIDWFNCGCPNNPTIQQIRHETVHRILTRSLWDGLFLDAVRFPSPFNGCNAFFSCFCPYCRAAAERLGYNFARMQEDVKFLALSVKRGGGKGFHLRGGAKSITECMELCLAHPGVFDWLRFKVDCITEQVAEIRRCFGASQHKLLGAYLYPPSIAFLVGQSYARLASQVDIVSPILLRLGQGNAFLGSELASLANLVSGALGMSRTTSERLVLEMVGLSDIPLESKTNGVVVGLSPKVIGKELTRARALIGEATELVPAIWMDDPLLGESISGCRTADGVCASILDNSTRKCIPEVAHAWQHMLAVKGPSYG